MTWSSDEPIGRSEHVESGLRAPFSSQEEMRRFIVRVLALMGLTLGADAVSASGNDFVITEEDMAERKVYSPYAGRAYADQVLFGDMHFHTNLSFDAGLTGTSLGAHDAYRLARGEEVIPDDELHERIYDVADSAGPAVGEDGRCKELVGNTVDIPTATFANSIGDAVLTAHWADPDFEPAEHAFYSVRVPEIPTPRWTTYDAAFHGIPLPDTVPASFQDRAYTSPIWYTP